MKKFGEIEIITGCMFAGKTEELIQRINTLLRTNHNVLIVKPTIDDRHDSDEIISHSGSKANAKAIRVGNGKEILSYVDKDTDAVCIDEIQFLGPEVVRVIEHLAAKGINIYAAGLDNDFRGEPFGIIPDLLARATKVTKLTSYCSVCGAPATRTQRTIDGKPASYYDPIVLVGAQESYEPRCRACHEVLDKPKYFEEK